MSDTPDKLQWHPAFYAAAELELSEDIEQLEIIPEYNLSKEPIRIDLLILKDKENSIKIKNEIGHIMKSYNIIEYKSPEDGMSIDDFFKTIGYACLYKGYGSTVDMYPIEEITVSLFREIYPREMFAKLESNGFEILKKYPGVYYIYGTIPFAAQVIVTSELTPENHSALRILSVNAKIEDVERFLLQAVEKEKQGEKNDIDAVLQVSMSANYGLYEEIRRNSVMCQALETLMKDKLDERYNAGIDKAKVEDVKRIMEGLNYSAEQAMDLLKIPAEDRIVFLGIINK